RRIPVDLTGIQHGVAALADVDERGLHARQDVLDATEVDIAGHRGVGLARHVVLDQGAVLKDADLGAVLLVAHDHDPLDTLAPGQELGLGDHGAAPPGLTALTTAHLLGLEPGGAPDRGDLITRGTRCPHLGRGARLLVAVASGPTAATTGTTAAVALAGLALAGLVVLSGGLARRCRWGAVVGRGPTTVLVEGLNSTALACRTSPAALPAAAATTAYAIGTGLVGVVRVL